MRRPQLENKLAVGLLAAVGGGYLMPLLLQAVLGLYSRYMADDFCTAAVARAMGLIEAERYWYLGWSGRYAYLFLIDLVSLIGPGLTPWLPAMLSGLWVVALGWSLCQLAPRYRPSPLVAAVLAILIVAATLCAIPNIAQSLDWRNSSLTYTAPLLLGSVLAGVLFRQSNDLGHDLMALLWQGLLVFVLAFLAGGFSEIYSALQFALVGLGLAAALIVNARRRHWRAAVPWLAGLLGSAAGLAAIALAPGTRARQFTFATPPGLPALIGNSIQYSRWFIRDAFLFQGPLVIAVAVCCALLVAVVAGRSAETPPRRWLVAGLLALPAVTFGLLVACYAPAFYALQYLPPDRVLIINWFVMISATAVWGSLAGGLLAPGWQAACAAQPKAMMAATWLVAALTIVPPLIGAAHLADALGAAQSYASTWDSYDQILTAARANGGAVTLARLTYPGGIDNLSSDPQFWVNKCLTQYYGVPVRALAPPAVPSAAELAQRAPLEASIGNVAQVLGYRLDQTSVRAGETLSVTVYWLPLANTDRPYTVFVHLYDPAAGSLGQTDGYPGQGTYLTTVWIHGQPFADTYQVPVQAGARAGEALFILGLYDLQTGQRLPVSGANAGPAGQDWVQFGQLRVTR